MPSWCDGFYLTTSICDLSFLQNYITQYNNL